MLYPQTSPNINSKICVFVVSSTKAKSCNETKLNGEKSLKIRTRKSKKNRQHNLPKKDKWTYTDPQNIHITLKIE